METQYTKETEKAAVAEQVKPKSQLFAVVEVDESYSTTVPAGTQIITARLYKELSEKLNHKGITAIHAIIRGRTIPFKEHRKLKFF